MTPMDLLDIINSENNLQVHLCIEYYKVTYRALSKVTRSSWRTGSPTALLSGWSVLHLGRDVGEEERRQKWRAGTVPLVTVDMAAAPVVGTVSEWPLSDLLWCRQ
jgi:hypothetical protein